MKYLFFIALIALCSCARDTPIIGGEIPFVVGKIQSNIGEQKLCKYVCLINDGAYTEGLTFNHRGAIIAPCGLYQIGDTIKLTK